MKERNSEENNEVLYVRKGPDMTRIHKKELDEKFITDNRKYRKKKLVVETNSGECENSRTSGQQVKSPLPLSYAGRLEKEVNFLELYLNLLEIKQTKSSKMETVPPTPCTNSSECQNSSCSFIESNKTELFSTQDRELVSVLVDLENIDNNREANAIGKTRLTGYFCSDTVFNIKSESFNG